MEILLLITIVIIAVAFINFKDYLSNPHKRPQIQDSNHNFKEEFQNYEDPYKALSKEEIFPGQLGTTDSDNVFIQGIEEKYQQEKREAKDFPIIRAKEPEPLKEEEIPAKRMPLKEEEKNV